MVWSTSSKLFLSFFPSHKGKREERLIWCSGPQPIDCSFQREGNLVLDYVTSRNDALNFKKKKKSKNCHERKEYNGPSESFNKELVQSLLLVGSTK